MEVVHCVTNNKNPRATSKLRKALITCNTWCWLVLSLCGVMNSVTQYVGTLQTIAVYLLPEGITNCCLLIYLCLLFYLQCVYEVVQRIC